MELALAGEAMEDSGGLPSDPEALQSVIDSADEEIRELERKLEQHEEKEQKYKVLGTNAVSGAAALVLAVCCSDLFLRHVCSGW